MKDKIIEILQSESWNVTNEAGDLCTVVEEEDFNDIAERIVKLFTIPVVVPSTFDFIIEYDDADGTMAKTVITGDNAPDAIWKFTEQYGLEWLTIKKVE